MINLNLNSINKKYRIIDKIFHQNLWAIYFFIISLIQILLIPMCLFFLFKEIYPKETAKFLNNHLINLFQNINFLRIFLKNYKWFLLYEHNPRNHSYYYLFIFIFPFIFKDFYIKYILIYCCVTIIHNKIYQKIWKFFL